MFSDVDADIYVMVDGDGTYDVSAAPRLIAELLDGGYDMVTGSRVTEVQAAYRPGHVFGNRLLTGLVSIGFGCQVRDMLSGYRVFSRRFVKSFPASSARFEVETELTVHALQMRLPTSEIETAYARPPGGVDQQAQHHPRRHSDPGHDRLAPSGTKSPCPSSGSAAWPSLSCPPPWGCRWLQNSGGRDLSCTSRP